MTAEEWMVRVAQTVRAEGLHVSEYPGRMEGIKFVPGYCFDYYTPKTQRSRRADPSILLGWISRMSRKKPADLPLLAIFDPHKPLQSAVASLLLGGATLEDT